MEVRRLQQVLAAATSISRPVANCCFSWNILLLLLLVLVCSYSIPLHSGLPIRSQFFPSSSLPSLGCVFHCSVSSRHIPIQMQRRNAIVVVLYRETEKIFMSSETLSLLLGVDVSTYEECGVATSAIQDTVSRLRNQVNSTIESHCAGFMGSSKFSFKDSVQDLYGTASNLIQNTLKPDIVNLFSQRRTRI